MGFAAFGIIALAVGVFCGYALYQAARREHRNAWAWGALGFFTNVIGLLIYRLTVGPIIKP